MALEALSSNDFSNFVIYDTISAGQIDCSGSSQTAFLFGSKNTANGILSNLHADGLDPLNQSSPMMQPKFTGPEPVDGKPNSAIQGRKKRRRRPRACKNKEEAETQRMTHIAVERNRRKQMNEHLNVLRSLMPESHIHRGDQASIVGGAIEYVKELEQLLQSLEAQQRLLQQPQEGGPYGNTQSFSPPPFAQFFTYPQFLWCQTRSEYPVANRPAIADIEVTLIETHANIRILSRRQPRQLFKMVIGLQALRLTILHLNVTTLDPLVLYSINAKVEEGCQVTSVDDIAGAVHHMLRIIADEASLT